MASPLDAGPRHYKQATLEPHADSQWKRAQRTVGHRLVMPFSRASLRGDAVQNGKEHKELRPSGA